MENALETTASLIVTLEGTFSNFSCLKKYYSVEEASQWRWSLVAVKCLCSTPSMNIQG